MLQYSEAQHFLSVSQKHSKWDVFAGSENGIPQAVLRCKRGNNIHAKMDGLINTLTCAITTINMVCQSNTSFGCASPTHFLSVLIRHTLWVNCSNILFRCACLTHFLGVLVQHIFWVCQSNTPLQCASPTHPFGVLVQHTLPMCQSNTPFHVLVQHTFSCTIPTHLSDILVQHTFSVYWSNLPFRCTGSTYIRLLSVLFQHAF